MDAVKKYSTKKIDMAEIVAERDYLKSLLGTIKCTAKHTKESLRVLTRKNSFQYYIINEKGDHNGTFIPRKDIRKARTIAQRDYNKAASKTIKKQLAIIDAFLAAYRPNVVDETFTKLHPGRRTLVTPVRETDDDFVASWQHFPYTGKPFEINAPEFYTSTGVRVRSKSEVIIADALSRAGIPFRYEYPTGIRGWGTLYPDFTCLDRRSRTEIIWEHFGMMSDHDYADVAIQKILRYNENGYVLGRNFIATFETADSPLNLKQVQTCIKANFS